MVDYAILTVLKSIKNFINIKNNYTKILKIQLKKILEFDHILYNNEF